jgi:ribosomal-protein-alanine N-acetyltransferase
MTAVRFPPFEKRPSTSLRKGCEWGSLTNVARSSICLTFLRLFNRMSKRDQISVGREHEQFPLPIRLVGRTVDVAFRQLVELRLEFLVEPIHIMHVNVISEAAIAGRGAVGALLFKQAKPHRFPMKVGIVVHSEQHPEAPQGPFKVGDVHERRDLDKVRHGAFPRLSGLSQLDAGPPVWGSVTLQRPDTMNLRPATAADIPLLLEVEHASPTAGHWTDAQYRRAIQPGRGDPERLVLVAEGPSLTAAGGPQSGSGILGFLVALHLAPEWELENIVVAPAARSKGLGRQLLEAFLAAARNTGSQSVFLEVRESNAPAHRLYETAGFTETGRRNAYYTNPSEDAILYRLEIGPV